MNLGIKYPILMRIVKIVLTLAAEELPLDCIGNAGISVL